MKLVCMVAPLVGTGRVEREGTLFFHLEQALAVSFHRGGVPCHEEGSGLLAQLLPESEGDFSQIPP